MVGDKKIIFMDSDIPSVYFPIGRPEDGGTCYFATEECLLHCPSGQVINEHEKYALEFFQGNNSNIITNKILQDFGELSEKIYNAKMIQWFAWGDCPPYMTEKIKDVILGLFKSSIPQYGFTRNKELWRVIPKEDRLNIGLTIDKLEKAKRVSISSGKLTVCPDFEEGYAQMIFNGKIQARCNGWWCVTEEETRNSDCTTCCQIGTGCYAR